MNRTTIILIGLFIVLAVVVAYFFFPSSKEREMSYKAGEMNVSIDSASVVKIQIERIGRSFTFGNTGGKWMITAPGKYPANVSSITQFIGDLRKLRVGSLISSNPEKQNLFQVDSTGVTVTVTERSGRTVTLIIGKMGPSFAEVYFRLPNSNDVYLGEGVSTWTLRQELKEWRDKSIFTAAADSMWQLDYLYKTKTATFLRDGTKWISGKDSLAADVMNSVLNTLASFRADDFIDTTIAPSPDPIGLKIRSTDEVAMTFFPQLPDSAKYIVQTSQSPQTYIITKYTMQQILKPVEKMIK